jgi:hypothetical protein
MPIIKTPRQKLMETPRTPGMVQTPKQQLLDKSGVLPRFAKGKKVKKTK